MDILFGLETEIGITRVDPGDLDVVAESISLVRSAQTPGVRMRWDYRFEDPHVDMRGFRVKELRQDTDEANYFARDAARELSFSEIKSDLALKNGARFYNDHAHPEYCMPECRTPLDLLQQDCAGDHLLMACVENMNDGSDNPVLLYKNNTDFLGHSYGCHENYLIPRALPWGQVADTMMAFLVSRQIVAGAGKFGWEAEDRYLQPGFQVSQRSDFFSVLQSVDTMQRRPIVNTRDEPHANEQLYRRFHAIVGDANLSPYSTWLKVGTTALVLKALTEGAQAEEAPHLRDPLLAIREISRDATWQWKCGLYDRTETTAIEIQKQYLRMVEKHALPHMTEDWHEVYKAWEEVIADLERDPLLCADRLDWAAKYQLIKGFQESEGIADDDPWLLSLDLNYHLLERGQGLYYGLLDAGHFRLPYPRDVIEGIVEDFHPPMTTRAAVRGACIERYGHMIDACQWDMVRIHMGNGMRIELDLRDLFTVEKVEYTLKRVYASHSPEELKDLEIARIIRPY
jgi:proteasome accessory factor PafA2